MSYTPKDGTGSAFPNKRKDKESHPDFRGDAMIDGKRYSFAIWKKEGAKGEFMSFQFQDYKEMEPRKDDDKPRHIPTASTDLPFDDENPF